MTHPRSRPFWIIVARQRDRARLCPCEGSSARDGGSERADPRATVHALIVADSFLTEQVDALTKELDWAWHWIQSGLHWLDESAADEVGGRAALHRVRGWFGTAGGRGGLP